MRTVKKRFVLAIGLLAAFVLWTAAVCLVDVQPIGPEGSPVGLAGINQYVHRLTGVHWPLYVLTDWLGLVPIAVCLGFAVLGLVQWIWRKSICRVDAGILLLGGFYIVVMVAYIFFEMNVINYRPVLIDGFLEASYPSSTTMLVLCVMPTALMQLNIRIRGKLLRRGMAIAIIAFTLFMVLGRLLSGVHWLSDIVGSLLLSAGLVTLYAALCRGNM